MKRILGILMFMIAVGGLQAIPTTCYLYYPKYCTFTLKDSEVTFDCPMVSDRKLSTSFGILNLFSGAFMPAKLVFVAKEGIHNFIWTCPD